MRQEIADLQKRVNDGRLSLGADKLKQLSDEIEEKTISLQRFGENAQREMQKLEQEIMDPIEEQILRVINQVGQEQGYTLIFKKFQSGLVYADETVDITPVVIQRFDSTRRQRRRRRGRRRRRSPPGTRLQRLTSLGELAELVQGHVRGNPARVVRGVRPLDAAGPDDLSFLTSAKYRDQARASRAGALLVGREESELAARPADLRRPGLGAGRALASLPSGGSGGAGHSPDARWWRRAPRSTPTASVGPQVVVGEESRIEAGAVLHAGAVVGARCRVGAATVLHPRAVLYDDTELGQRVVVHAGAVLGADGFGYAAARRRAGQGAAGGAGGGRGRRRDRRQHHHRPRDARGDADRRRQQARQPGAGRTQCAARKGLRARAARPASQAARGSATASCWRGRQGSAATSSSATACRWRRSRRRCSRRRRGASWRASPRCRSASGGGR